MFIVFTAFSILVSFCYAVPEEILASNNACGYSTTYTATIFNAPYDGQISGVKVVYNAGNSAVMTCDYQCSGARAKWGCPHCSSGERKFMIELMKVTDASNYAGYTIYPTSNTPGYIRYGSGLSCSRGCTQQLYWLNGQDINDDVITFTGETYQVTTNDQFMMQVGEGCCGVTTQDNTGHACAEIYFLYDNYKNCEADGEIKHVNWDALQNAADNSAQIPYSSFTMSVDKTTLEVEFNISLEYVGSSTGGNMNNNYNLGTTYVIDFQSYQTSGDFINKPGNCQNRLASSFNTIIDFTNMWGYSNFPHQINNLGTNVYLSYPPPSEYWTLSIDYATCSPINYNGIFSWNDFVQCQDYNGNDLIEVIDDGTSITLSGTLYVNLVSPYSMSTTDTGVYRSFPLIQQDFEISLIKQINILSSTGVDLFIASIIAINEDETDGSFQLSILTQSADYIELINPIVLSTPLGTASTTIISVTSTCLVASSYTCGQIFTVRIDDSQINCPPADFSGTYNIQFDVSCPSNEDVCDTFIDDNDGSTVVLEVISNFIDETCEPELYEIIFNGQMIFYDDEQFSIIHNDQNGENNYVIGQDIIYIQVETNIPDDGSGDNFQIFGVEINNVFVCTVDDNTDINSNLDQQNGNGGCLSSNIDPDGPYNIISNGISNNIYETQIISNNGISNIVRFSFKTFDIGRTNMYVHVQLTLILQNGIRRRLVGLHLLQSNDDNTSNQIRHFIDSTTIVSDTNILVTESRIDDSDGEHTNIGYQIKLIIVYLTIICVIFFFV